MAAAGSGGSVYIPAVSILSLPGLWWALPVTSTSSCIRAGWQMQKSEVKPWESGLEMSTVLINHPSLLYAFHLQHLPCQSQHKFFNPQFISSWCSLCYSRNPHKGDRKLENQNPGIILTRVLVPALNVMPPPGDRQGYWDVCPCQGTPGTPQGYWGQQGKEGRKVSVGVNSPQPWHRGKNSCSCFCQSPAPAAATPSCMAMRQPGCCGAAHQTVSTSPPLFPLSEWQGLWVLADPPCRGGCDVHPIQVWEHQTSEVVCSIAACYSHCGFWTLKPLGPVGSL